MFWMFSFVLESFSHVLAYSSSFCDFRFYDFLSVFGFAVSVSGCGCLWVSVLGLLVSGRGCKCLQGFFF